MCGRYSLTTPAEAVRAYFAFVEQPNLAPRANIAPRQEVAAVRLDEGDSGDDRHFCRLRWGLIPAWAKDAAIGDRMINARAESVAEKPAFRAAFRLRRCLVVADGFYEWRSEDGRKQPYRIILAESAVLAFAGLWERWRDPQSQEAIETCAIVTGEASPALRQIHHRMPVILAPADFTAWLSPATPTADALALIHAQPAREFVTYRVSMRLNSAANDDLSLLESADPATAPAPQPRLL
jgi:putative SOS response-associated peptidase YedK